MTERKTFHFNQDPIFVLTSTLTSSVPLQHADKNSARKGRKGPSGGDDPPRNRTKTTQQLGTCIVMV